MPDPAVVLAARQFKQGLLLREQQQMQAMARKWLDVERNLEAQIAALRQWAAENPPTPVKTYRDDFFEKFPEAEKDGDGYPPLWVTRVYGIKRLGGPVSAGFKDAWDKPLGYWSGAEAKKDG